MWEAYLAAGLFLITTLCFSCVGLVWLVKTMRSGRFKEYPLVTKSWHSTTYVLFELIMVVGFTAIVGLGSVVFIDIVFSENSYS